MTKCMAWSTGAPVMPVCVVSRAKAGVANQKTLMQSAGKGAIRGMKTALCRDNRCGNKQHGFLPFFIFPNVLFPPKKGLVNK